VADDRPLNVDRLPTLTEVLELGPELTLALELPPTEPAAVPDLALEQAAPVPWEEIMRAMAARASATPLPAAVNEEAIVQRVLAELQPRIAATLEARLRDALAPALARAGETLIRESRDELSAVTRALVEESLAQVLRQPPPG
jgi:hypothetical protein